MFALRSNFFAAKIVATVLKYAEWNANHFHIGKMAKAFVLVVIFLSSGSVRGSEEVPVSDDFVVQKWDADDGLASNNVTAITQTRDGFLWIGTDRGLVRFDGVQFKTFLRGFSAGAIRFLAAEKNGALWLCAGAKNLARFENEQITPVWLDGPSEGASIESLVADEGGVLAGFDSLAAAYGKEGKFMRFDSSNGIHGRGAVKFIHQEKTGDGKIWFTTETSFGFFDGKKFVTLAQDVSSPVLHPRRAGGVWLARGNVLLILKENREVLYGTNVPWRGGTSEIAAMHEDRTGALWIGTRSQGLFRFNGEFSRVATSHNSINALAEDRDGNIWAGIWGGGIDRIRPRAVRIHDARTGLPSDSVFSVCEDHAGALWLAMRGAGAVRLAEGVFKSFTETDGWPGGVLTGVAPARGGGVWLGTSDGLVREQDGVFEKIALAGESVTVLREDREGVLWIGTRRGLSMWREGKLTRITLDNGVSEITALSEDHAGRLWIGTGAGRLHKREGTQFMRFDISKENEAPAIEAILPDDSGALWIGTRRGLVRFTPGEVVRITSRDGLPDDDLRQIVADDCGNFWFGSSRGLFRAARQELEKAAAGENVRVDYVRYGRDDGLGSIEFAENNAAIRARDGHLFFATHNGLVEIDPKKLPVQSEAPRVKIEEILADGRSVPFSPSARIDIAPRTQKIEIRYTAPNLTTPHKTRFRFRFDDENWSDAGNQRVATILNVAPGVHHFSVLASNGEGRWMPLPMTIALHVRAAFWQTIWFRVFELSLAIALIFAIARFVSLQRVRSRLRALERERALHAERSRIARDMHDDLGARLTSMALLSEAARAENGLAPEAASRLEKISRTARELSLALDEIVWTVNPRNDRLDRVIAYLGEYGAEFLAAGGIPFEQQLPENVPDVPIASDVRHHLLLAVKEAFHNAAKHAAATRIALQVTVVSGMLIVRIEDNGRGMGAENGARKNGEGLANMHARLAHIGGDCKVESQAGEGTIVTFELPLEETKISGE